MILTFLHGMAAAGDQPAISTEDRLTVLYRCHLSGHRPWRHDGGVPATPPGRSQHSILSHGRSHDTRANQIWTAAGA
jgi:hypothetical protein